MRHTEAVHGKTQVLQGVKAWENMRHQRGILTTGADANYEDGEIYVDSDAYCGYTGTWNCAICGREFSSQRALSQHANSGVHSENSYRCDDCGRQFNALASLYSHVDATNCKHVRHVANTLGNDYQQGNNFLQLTNGIAQEATLYFDGSAQPNPGRGGAGFVLYDASGRFLEQGSVNITDNGCTSNQAEYCALILGFMCAKQFHIRTLQVKGDSQLIMNQMERINQVNSQRIYDLFQTAYAWQSCFQRVMYKWIPRVIKMMKPTNWRRGARDETGTLNKVWMKLLILFSYFGVCGIYIRFLSKSICCVYLCTFYSIIHEIIYEFILYISS